MSTIIYLIMIMLFAIYITWTWNSTKEIENLGGRVLFIVVGTILVTIITYILFLFSRTGITYPKAEMIGEVGKVILLVFVPINGFATLPQVANLITRMKNKNISKEDREKKKRIIITIAVILIIFECIYFRNIQTGIINFINVKQ